MNQRIFFLLLIILIPLCAKAQTLSQAEKEKLINSLYITDIDSMFTINYAPNAIQAIIDYIVNDSIDFQEAIPAIIENIWNVSPFDETQFLWALYLLNASQTEQYSLAFIDSVDHYSDTLFTRLKLKLLATNILFELGNYSKYNFVFDELSQENPEISSYLISMLSDIVINIPSEEIRAKNALINIASNDSEAIYRYYAISDLIDKYGIEMIPFFCERFVQEEDLSILVLLYRDLSQYKDELIKSAFKIKIISIQETLTRYQILSELLLKYGSISDYKFVFDYQKSGIDPENHNLINDILIHFIPLRPDIFVFSMIDTLRSYTEQLYQYQWITSSKTYKAYLSLLKEQKNESDTLQAAQAYLSNINLLIARLPSDFSFGTVTEDGSTTTGSLITEAGYKFMYYYSVYIKEDLQKIINGITN